MNMNCILLQDGDEVIMTGYSTKGDQLRVGFGDVSGKVLPAGTTTTGSAPIVAPPKIPTYRYKLYGYWQSTSSWRVRLALGTKCIPYEYIAMDLSVMRGNNIHRLPAEFKDKNLLEQVPVLEAITTNPDGTTESTFLTQSLAIMEYLDEMYPNGPSLLPKNPLKRAKAREIAEIVNSGIQPLQNIALMRQIKQLELTPESSDETPVVVDGKEFAIVKIRKGLEVLEKLVSTQLNGTKDLFAAGTTEPSIADMCIIPQLYNGKKFGVDLSKFPTLMTIQNKCETLSVFVNAHPFQQPDAATS